MTYADDWVSGSRQGWRADAAYGDLQRVIHALAFGDALGEREIERRFVVHVEPRARLALAGVDELGGKLAAGVVEHREATARPQPQHLDQMAERGVRQPQAAAGGKRRSCGTRRHLPRTRWPNLAPRRPNTPLRLPVLRAAADEDGPRVLPMSCADTSCQPIRAPRVMSSVRGQSDECRCAIFC